MSVVYETVSVYKKAAKGFIKGAIKAKVFGTGTNGLVVKITKSYDKKAGEGVVVLTAGCGEFTAKFTAAVNKRVFNKVTPEFFAVTKAQLDKLKGFGGLTVEEGGDEE